MTCVTNHSFPRNDVEFLRGDAQKSLLVILASHIVGMPMHKLSPSSSSHFTSGLALFQASKTRTGLNTVPSKSLNTNHRREPNLFLDRPDSTPRWPAKAKVTHRPIRWANKVLASSESVVEACGSRGNDGANDRNLTAWSSLQLDGLCGGRSGPAACKPCSAEAFEGWVVPALGRIMHELVAFSANASMHKCLIT